MCECHGNQVSCFPASGGICNHGYFFAVDLGLTTSGSVPIYGLNYKDERSDAIEWLGKLGNPYRAIAADRDGRVGIDWGVYGVPETFVIDQKGVIRYKHIGPLDAGALRDTVLPLVEKLKKEAS